MSDFFGDLKSGIKFPEVVMNSGPLPPSGGLPAPLHENADARINYNSTLLGNLEPYAYGKPGYLSSQTAYLNIPHKIQKIVPVVHLPEAKVGAVDTFELSHPIDDGDIAFTIRLNRNSIFCTGLKNGDINRAGLSGIVDPMINLCTLNYVLSGFQFGLSQNNPKDMWHELLYNMDAHRFPQSGARDYHADPINLQDLIHVVRHCIRPLGITRGSEKQGGQNEATLSPATWPVSFVVSLTIDGKESNVVNVWHKHNMSAGDDLVLRWKLMPLRQYTLNHYYKRVTRQNWGNIPEAHGYVWQLVPDIMHLESSYTQSHEQMLAKIPPRLRHIELFHNNRGYRYEISPHFPWQNLGYWHIGRSQIMSGAYGADEYWNNDLANILKTNHLDITFQPMFTALPTPLDPSYANIAKTTFAHTIGSNMSGLETEDIYTWKPKLQLESMFEQESMFGPESLFGQDSLDAENGISMYPEDDANQLQLENDIPAHSLEDLGLSLFEHDGSFNPTERDLTLPSHTESQPIISTSQETRIDTGLCSSAPQSMPVETTASKPSTTGKDTHKQVKRKTIGGSLLKADGSSEARIVAML